MKIINLEKELEKIKILINKTINLYLRKKYPYRHYRLMGEYSHRSGKRLRGALTILSTSLYGGQIAESFLTAAIIEVMQDWLLIHDDVFDQAKIRRGKISLNEMSNNNTAINAGDALHALNWKMLGDNIRFLGERRGWKVFYQINEILQTTLAGQYLEIRWNETNRLNIRDKDYFDLIYHKTAVYSVIGPLELGALIAGQGQQEFKEINLWAKPLGYAFQIRDDVMNLKNNATVLKKDSQNDLREGKRTLILKNLLADCTPAEKEIITLIYAKKPEAKTTEDLNYLNYLIKKYKCLEKTQAVILKLTTQAKNNFLEIYKNHKNSWAKNIIIELIEFIAQRDC